MEELLVDDSELSAIRVRPTLRQYFVGVWQRRHFVLFEARAKSLDLGRDTFLGRWWLLLNPLLQLAVYLLVFGVILQTSRGIENFVGFLVIGVSFFGFFSQAINQSAGLLQRSRIMVVSYEFPKLTLPISLVLRQLIDNIIPALVAIGVALVAQKGQHLSWVIVLVVPLYILFHFFILGCTFFICRWSAFVPDVKQIVPVVTRGLFFLSGIFYDLDRFDSHPVIRETMMLNPVYQFLTALRSVVLYGELPSQFCLVFIVSITTLVATIGAIYFWRAEDRYASVR
mgnify:CR=1 FL=1